MNKLERAEERLELYYKEEKAILSAQEYSIGTKRLRRAELEHVQKMIKQLENEVETLKSHGKNRALRGVPLDI